MDETKRPRGNILAVDDVTENLDLLAKILTAAGYAVRTTTSGVFALQTARAEPPDIILLDIRMPEMDGFEVCRRLKEDPRLSGIPVIFISALSEIHDKVQAFEAGGVDYLTKPFQEAEVLARVRTHLALYHMQTRLEEMVSERSADLLRKTLALQDEIEERKKTEAALRDAEFRYRTVADFTYAWEYWEGPDGALRYVSPSCERVTGYPAEAFLNDPGLLHRIVLTEDRAAWEAHRTEAMRERRAYEIQFRINSSGGQVRWIEHTCHAVIDESGSFLGFRVSNRDVSERKELERELRQAQKMEAIGTLAGGIAHDFNNILSSILGFSELSLIEKDLPPAVRDNLTVVVEMSHRATNLVRQILTFSRKNEQELSPLQVSLLVKEALKLLRASIPSSIAIQQDISALDLVLADPTQIHQIVMNLCTNAYYAMKESGGTLAVSLQRVELQEEDVFMCRGLTPGSYLLLKVSDSGCGMDKDTLEKIFEPYFTTKSPGEGTGLGLAMVASIVRNHKGHIAVNSKPGVGTTFHVYLPVCNPQGKANALSRPTTEETLLPSGTEQLMVVDDEEKIISIYRDLLGKFGYTVSAFASSQEALESFRRNPSGFDLVLTDLTMPVMDGVELAKRLISIRPGLPVILCTGFNALITQKKAKMAGIDVYLQKPFTQKDILQTIRKALDERKKI